MSLYSFQFIESTCRDDIEPLIYNLDISWHHFLESMEAEEEEEQREEVVSLVIPYSVILSEVP